MWALLCRKSLFKRVCKLGEVCGRVVDKEKEVSTSLKMAALAEMLPTSPHPMVGQSKHRKCCQEGGFFDHIIRMERRSYNRISCKYLGIPTFPKITQEWLDHVTLSS